MLRCQTQRTLLTSWLMTERKRFLVTSLRYYSHVTFFHFVLKSILYQLQPYPLIEVSSPYLALDEIYHLIYAPIPRSVTLRTSAVDSGHQAKHRILTRAHALFQEAYARAADSTMPAGYIPKPKLQFPA